MNLRNKPLQRSAAGTAEDISTALPKFKGAYDLLALRINQAAIRGWAGGSRTLQHLVGGPWGDLMNEGLRIADGILSTREIPKGKEKGLEMAYRLFSRSSRVPRDIYKWWGTNQKRFIFIMDAAKSWPSKVKGGGQLFALGSFTVHNTVGATGKTLTAFKKALAAAEKMVQKNALPGFSRTLYGDVYFVGSIGNAHHAAWYHSGEDTLYIRPPKAGWGMQLAQTIVHELGHRYWRKFASKEGKRAWARHHEDTAAKRVDLDLPGVGDPLPIRIKGAPRGWRPVVDRKTPNLYFYKRHDGTEGFIESIKVLRFADKDQGDLLRFPTAYSAMNQEEHFCEALKLKSAGILPKEHSVPFNAIWVGPRRGKKARQDRELVKWAENLYRKIEKALSRAPSPLFTNTKGQEVLMGRDIGIPGLILIFDPDGDRTFHSETTQGGDVIQMGLRGLRRYVGDVQTIAKVLRSHKQVLIHELTHFIDRFRLRGGFGQADKSYPSGGPDDPVKYYNHPLELNAYFIQALSLVSAGIEDIQADINPGRPDSRHETAVWKLDDWIQDYGTDFRKLRKVFWRGMFKGVRDNLTDKNRRRFDKRIYDWWSKVSREAKKTLDDLIESGDEMAQLMRTAGSQFQRSPQSASEPPQDPRRLMGIDMTRKVYDVLELRPSRKARSGTDRLDTYLKGFYSRYPAFRQYKPRIVEKDLHSSSNHPEAQQLGGEIFLGFKFWEHERSLQDFILAHEIGHFVESKMGYAKLLKHLADFGIDAWDTGSLPFAQFNGSEAWADSFASYFTDGDVKRRYPEWAAAVKAIHTNKQARSDKLASPRLRFPWEDVEKQIRDFLKASEKMAHQTENHEAIPFLGKVSLDEMDALTDMLQRFQLRPYPFTEWLDRFTTRTFQKGFKTAYDKIARTLHTLTLWVFNASNPRFADPEKNIRQTAKWLPHFKKDLAPFVALLRQARKEFKHLRRDRETPAPGEFAYKGFKILNPDGLGEQSVFTLLDGVSYAQALFKRRGLEDLIHKGVQSIILRQELPGDAHGLYHSRSRDITLSLEAAGGTGRFLKEWVHEVFIHEFGHHLHMSYLSREGYDFWGEAWSPVDKAHDGFRESIKINQEDRKGFFKVFERVGWSFQKAGKFLKGLDRLKYLSWLRDTGMVKPEAKVVRLTPRGHDFEKFFKDPEAKILDNLQGSGWTPPDEWWVNQRSGNMLHHRLTLRLDWAGQNLLDWDFVEKLKKKDTSIADAIEQVAEEWGIPSNYGKTNVLEDFAESFVLFMTAPQKMTERAAYRMKRTLWLSGFGRKPVMRLASSVSQGYPQGARVRA